MSNIIKQPYPEYAQSLGVRASDLKHMRTSPWHCWANTFAPNRPQDGSPSKALGNLTHTLVLEPHLVNDLYVLGCEGETKASKSAKERIAANPEAEWVTHTAHQSAVAMSQALLSHKVVAKILGGGGMAEHSVYWTDPQWGVRCKARPDWIPDGKGWIIDLKTTRQNTPRAFGKDAAHMGYVLQAAYYMDGVEAATGNKPKGFAWVVVENAYPHAVSVYTMGYDSATHQEARNQYKMLLRAYKECMLKYGSTNAWPKDDAPQNIADYLPAYFSDVPDFLHTLFSNQ